jgi:hypothetical protein
MDTSFIEFVKNELSLTLNGNIVPVFFFTIQKWTEFTNTWEKSDEFKNMTIPFITILRKPDIQDGTNQAGLWNIPGKKAYTYVKVPTWDGVRQGIDLYKICQPTSVDLSYEVRLFANKLNDLNTFTTKFRKAFQSRQAYLNVKGHPLPLVSESTGDESLTDDMEHRKYYVVNFELKLLGYILDEEDFQIVPTINRVINLMEIVDSDSLLPVISSSVKEDTTIVYDFIFKPKSTTEFTFTSKYSMSIISINNITNINNIIISVNNIEVFSGLEITSPIAVHNQDQITVKVDKDYLSTSTFELTGTI